MPTYNFLNRNTGKHIERFFDTIAEAEQYEKDNPHLEWLCSAPGIVDSFRVGIRKPDDNFRDRLKDIKKTHKHSKINTF
jgi:hypothetical protein